MNKPVIVVDDNIDFFKQLKSIVSIHKEEMNSSYLSDLLYDEKTIKALTSARREERVLINHMDDGRASYRVADVVSSLIERI